jgi:hypothetical protein
MPGPDTSHLPPRLQSALAASRLEKASFYGCTEADLEELRKAQGVECLPEIYRQVMLSVGGYGLRCILNGYADFGEKVKGLKWYTEVFKGENLDFPPDLFVFMGDVQGTGCHFFRTAGCPDDPPVYGYWEDGAYHKLAESLTDYLVRELTRDVDVPDEVSDRIFGTDYTYDAGRDTFILREPPEDMPLDTLVEQIAQQAAKVLGWLKRKPEGCTDADLEKLRKAQGVTSLPETYRRLMKSVGRAGLDTLLTGIKSTYSDVIKAKANFAAKSAEQGQPVPVDAFVFALEVNRQFYFFQTQDQGDDPAVMVYDIHRGFFRLAEHLSTYLREQLDHNRQRAWERAVRQVLTSYQFDPARKEFYPLPQPDADASLDKVREVIAGRGFWKERQGCTESDLEALASAQSVDCLPEVYREIMSLIGRDGINSVFGEWSTFTAVAGINKASFPQIDLPPDVFFFVSQQDMFGNLLFFRTRGCEDDPSVYAARFSGLYHAADHLTTFMLQRLDWDWTGRGNYEKKWLRRPVRYDPGRDEFLARSPSAP